MKAYAAHVKSDRAKWIIVAVAILVIAVILCGIMTTWFSDFNPYCWFGHKYENGVCTKCGDVKNAMELENGGFSLSNIKQSRSIRLASTRAAAASNDGSLVDTLTATILPAQADDKRVEWTVGWKDGHSENVADYVTLTSDGLTATVTCKQAFEHQVVVTCKSLDNPSAVASCTYNYVERVTGVTFTMPKTSTQKATLTYTVETSKHTIPADIKVTLSDYKVEKARFADEFLVCFEDNGFGIGCVFDISSYNQEQDIIRYVDNGLEFVNGNDYRVNEPIGQWFYPSGLIGCFFGIDYQNYEGGTITDGDIIAAFRYACSCSNAQAYVTATISATYNGKTYNSMSKQVPIVFDGDAFHIAVTGLSLSHTTVDF